MAAAQAAWLAISQPFDGRRGNDEHVAFRRYGHVVAALHFSRDAIHLQRVESLSPGAGGFLAFLRRIIALAAEHGLAIRGNARAFATPEAPHPDQARLVASYAGAGFLVGDGPLFPVAYTPDPGRAATRDPAEVADVGVKLPAHGRGAR